MVILGVVAGAVGGQLAGGHHVTTYSATATLVVQSGASVSGPGSANDAETLAITYAALLPKDQAILARVAQDLGIPIAEVSRNLGVEAESGTALLQVRYTAATAAGAVTGANAVTRAVSSLEPTGRAIAGGSVAVVSTASSARPSNRLLQDAGLVGALLGLVVGVGTALVAERVDRRVDDVDTLEEATGGQATPRPGGISATELARVLDGRAPGQVVLVPMATSQSPAANRLAAELATAWPDRPDRTPVRVTPPFSTTADKVTGEGATVLVVGSGERFRAVADAAARLRLAGRGPAWSVLVAGGRGRGR